MRNGKTKFVWFVITLTLVYLGIGGFVFGQEKLSGGPFVQTPTLNGSVPDATRVNIVWYTDTDCPRDGNGNCAPTCYIQYRPLGATQCPGSVQDWCTVNCTAASWKPANCCGSTLVSRYELSINGLTPGGLYEYRLFRNGDNRQLEPCPDSPCNLNGTCSTSYYTAGSNTCAPPNPVFEALKPSTASRIEFVVFGDSGANPNTPQKQMTDQILATCPGVDFGVHVGDIIYPSDGASSQWNSGGCKGYPTMYFDAYHRLIREIPFYTALGNHDSDWYCFGLCCRTVPNPNAKFFPPLLCPMIAALTGAVLLAAPRPTECRPT